MADTVAQLVEQVLSEGELDAAKSQALRWLTVRQRQMCRRSRWLRKTITLGAVTGGVGTYTVPAEVVEILEVRLGGVVYGHARHVDPAEGAQGYVWLGGAGGIAGREDTSAGAQVLRLYPTPTASGAVLEIYAVCRPPDLAEGSDSTLVIPGEYCDALVAGAIATAYLRLENRPDLASPHETVFNDGCGELTQQSNRRFRGTGPAQIRVAGINA